MKLRMRPSERCALKKIGEINAAETHGFGLELRILARRHGNDKTPRYVVDAISGTAIRNILDGMLYDADVVGECDEMF